MATELTAPLTDTEERNLRAVSDVLHYWNTGNIEGVLTFYNDDIEWRNVAMEETYDGKEAVGAFLQSLLTAFPDLTFEVTEKIARGNTISEKWFIRGTHRGPFMGIPPTGRQVEIPGLSMVQMRDGRFASDHFYFDSGIVLRQMGLMPPLSVTASAAGRIGLWLAVKRALVLRAALGIAGGGVIFSGLRRMRQRAKG